jgi:hypothetical protein
MWLLKLLSQLDLSADPYTFLCGSVNQWQTGRKKDISLGTGKVRTMPDLSLAHDQ